MSSTAKPLLKAIEASPDGPEICAIFDFDGTIISGYSAIAFIREQLRRGDLSVRDFLELASAMTNFGLGNLGFSGMMAITTQFMRGIDEQAYIELGEDLFTKQIARLVYPESRALIEAHLAKGHTVGIISSATPYQVEPAARDLGIENVLCTQLEVEDGVFTGSVVRPTCFGQGKVDAAEVLAESVGANLDDGFFYSDSTDDQLLLEHVGNPVALNPSDKLRAVARDNNWPIASFGSRGRPTLGQFVRSIAATVSLVPSFAAGLPIYALTGSRREATNFSIGLFAETASALINLDLRVNGEENLWKQRPAVFIFNHQSKADVVIGAKLLRRDMAGVGKQEIKKMPVIGKVLEMGGVVMIDRKNAASAIEAMQPLVDAMRNEGKSVALAPEGTRTVSPNLAPFKKGAFHLAIQAGVPIVPVVIRNAGDVAPKGDFVFRPATVEVDVLPPVDTSDWSAETIEEHIREVRNMFLKTLGQPEEKVPAAKTAKKPASKAKAATKTKAKTKGKAVAKKKAPAKAAAKPKATAKAKAKAKSTTTAKRRPAAKARPKTVAKARPKARPKSASS
ncbi:HAD-IB family hydrolase [Congregibacter brevis]|uniref:1-acyl-sn-glycerol-3-phosphate acyltransferase n=1 Tax=Congregibacter brevis TaxID=3081201 RepID=A0ABZ0IEY9_9GAMM|nr:HAD-IB family hydrolase [Congregibacter sp. IMCC45268]